MSAVTEMGYFGNIWVRQHFLETAGQDNGGGHTHHFDHVTLLARGKVLVEVDGCEAKEFTAPTFIVIKKEHKHKFTALQNGTLYYCVFALRDVDGNVSDFYSGDNNPYGSADSDGHETLKSAMNSTSQSL
jgi:hypothetical protein